MKNANLALITGVLIGADIETFLRDMASNEIVSAEPYIKGTKDKPFNFDKSHKYFAISLDNVAAEFCIPPVTTEEDWVRNIQKCLEYINSTIPNHLCTAALPAATLHPRFLDTPNAKLFGCEPDFNVWQRSVNQPPKATDATLRSCGGHIHVGYDNAEKLGIEVCEQVVKAMDVFIGVPSILQEPDNQRKLLYGKAGAFRKKEYGVEYRTVSNYYLAEEKLTRWAFNNTMTAVDYVNNGGIEMIDAYADQIQFAINHNDKVTAQNLINSFDIQMA